MKNYASNLKNEYNFFNLMKYKSNVYLFIYNIKLIIENIQLFFLNKVFYFSCLIKLFLLTQTNIFFNKKLFFKIQFPNTILFLKTQKTVIGSCFQKLFFRIVFKNTSQTSPKSF